MKLDAFTACDSSGRNLVIDNADAELLRLPIFDCAVVTTTVK
jgi:hypothetical protein